MMHQHPPKKQIGAVAFDRADVQADRVPRSPER
jgi:hypothetical protein